MDKFDDFLKSKAQVEDDDFTLPKSFDSKIEDVLGNLEDKKSNDRWYINKKTIAIAASFAFVCLIGLKAFLPESNMKMRDSAAPETALMEDRSAENGISPAAYSQKSYGNSAINVEEIGSLNIKSLENATYKFVNKKDDIDIIINFINDLDKKPIEEKDIEEWDFLISTNGGVNHSIVIKDNTLNIDDRYFEISNDKLLEFKEIYKSLSYEEKDIKYCNY